MAECKFCESLESHKQCENFWREREKEPFKYEYTVALVIKQWLPSKGKRGAGRTTDYRYQGIGYKLNFCPECGRKLRGRRLNENPTQAADEKAENNVCKS